MYFDFKAYKTNIERGQTPFTPCISILCQLNDMLRFILDKGVTEKIKGTRALAGYFRGLALENGISIPRYPLTNALTPIIFDLLNAYDVFEKLWREYGMYINPNGYMRERICRVGHMGDLTFSDYDKLVSAILEINGGHDIAQK
jgi:aspartate aminotransferase-like enzyme